MWQFAMSIYIQNTDTCILLFTTMFGLNSHRILLLLKPRKESGTRFWKNMLTTWHGLIHEISTWTWQDRWFLYMLEALWLRSLVISRFGWGFKQFLWNFQPDLEGRQSSNHLHVYVDIVFLNAAFFPMITSGEVETVYPYRKRPQGVTLE